MLSAETMWLDFDPRRFVIVRMRIETRKNHSPPTLV
jgi:hypothetical protein